MKQKQDYTQDISEIRSMMERSSRFMSISGLGAILAGVYGLTGAFVAYAVYDFSIDTLTGSMPATPILLLAIGVLTLATGSVVLLSYRKAKTNGEKIVWNATSQRLFLNLAIPLVTGGIFVLILIDKGLIGLTPAAMLIFYGMAMFSASKFTYPEVRSMGIVLTITGLLSAYFIEFGLLWWALGFGGINILYGVYIHFKY